MTIRIAKIAPTLGVVLGAFFSNAAIAANPFVSRQLIGPSPKSTEPAENAEIPANEHSQGPISTKDTTESHFISRFPESGFGDLSVVSFESGTAYKINLLNLNVVVGEMNGNDFGFPLQLFYGDSSSNNSEADTNAKSLIDPTEGVAFQLPIAYLIKPKNGICHFSNSSGYCVAGVDLTVRRVKIEVEDSEGGASKKKAIFAASAGMRLSIVLPVKQILNLGGSKDDGYLGIGTGVRLYHQQSGGQGIFVDPNVGTSFIGRRFSAFTAEAELGIHKLLKLRFEYFKPLQDKDVLKKIQRFSFVFTPSHESSGN